MPVQVKRGGTRVVIPDVPPPDAAEGEPAGGLPIPVDADGRALRSGRAKKPSLGAPPAAEPDPSEKG